MNLPNEVNRGLINFMLLLEKLNRIGSDGLCI
jgi:hypothetical protein